MTRPQPSDIRYRVDPGDVPAEKAARRLGLSLEKFEMVKHSLFDRGFPQPDETTGNYCLEAVDAWRRARYPRLFPLERAALLTPTPKPRDAREKLGGRDRG
jgi:hypothetical protein